MTAYRWQTFFIVFACLAACFCAYADASKHKNKDKVLFSDLKTLTFYRGRTTTARRLEPVQQLTCEGRLCRRYQPAVIQCESRGDQQWRCESQLPPWAQLGAVQVSCEGWDYAEDQYVLRGSCALRYELLPTSKRMSGRWESILFSVLFWGLAIFILLSFLHACLGSENGPPGGAPDAGPNDAPPPYQKHPGSTFSSPVTRTLSALGLGAVAGYLFRSRRTGPQPMYDEAYRPFPAYGTMPHHGVYYGDAATQLQSDNIASSSSAHTSAGFGGTENR